MSDYAGFAARGEPEWAALEGSLQRAREGLTSLDLDEVERLAALHRRAMSDFAYARSHYPGTPVVPRLRQLAFDGHRLLAARREPALKRMLRFFLVGYRECFQSARRHLLIALAVFVGATALGFVVATMQPSFINIFFGPDAIDGIRRGEIWTDSVGSVVPPAVLSSSIFTNNITVALVTWAGGALAGAFTLFALLQNGAMFGSVLAACWQYEMLDRLFAFIAAHGPLELFLIVVAGAAGLMLGEGAVAPGNRPRAESFADAARSSALLMVGTVPWFVLLGLVEGNISPVMTLPTSLKAAVGAILIGVFLAYALFPVSTPGKTTK